MEVIKCDICEEDINMKICIKIKQNSNIQVCCKDCKPEYAQEIQNLWNNPKIKIKNVPIKKVS
jgi:ribosome-binding protein aMBF1 (putative translation factor)